MYRTWLAAPWRIQCIGWLEKSAAQSYGQAIYMLGNIYMQGKFVPKDEQKSQAYYSQSMPLLQQAASRNDTTAILLLGFHQLQNGEKEGIALLEKASSMGNADAMIALGAVYEAGKMVTKDAGKAMKLYSGAAEKENTMGMYMLGRHLYEGDLGTQNTNEGLQWLEKAGSLGYTEVYMYLGETFKNSKKGAGYFEKGAELDNVECMIKAADDSYIKNGWISNSYALTLIQRAARTGPAKSFPLYLKAAELGDIDILLIDYFKEGLGTPRSKQQAAYWRRKYDEQERNKKSISNTP